MGNGCGLISNAAIATTTGFNSNFVPTPAEGSAGNNGFVAIVGNNNFVYLYVTTDGVHFSYLQQISGYSTVSRPAWMKTPGGLEVAFLTGSSRNLVIGPATTGPSLLSGISWGNNNHNGGYAGIGLAFYNNYVYAFGQDTASSQNLSMYTAGHQVPGLDHSMLEIRCDGHHR
jgi:hypothetical protein